MFRRRLPILLSVWMIAVSPLLNANAASAADPKPNIVFFLVDDMGAADGACFGSGYYHTPNMDRLAAGGVLFTQAYAACAVCSPTRAAIQTGKAPARLHITDWIGGEKPPPSSRFALPDWRKELPPAEITIGEALKKAGYATGHIGKWHLGGPESSPERQGYDVNVAGGEIGHPASYFWPFGDEGASHRVPGMAESSKKGDYLTDALTDEALKFIDAHREGPFFLELWHYAVHSPLMGKDLMVHKYANKPSWHGQSNAVYAAMIESVDESLGRVLRKLTESGLSDRTIVVFTSDNGGVVHFKVPATSNFPLRLGKGYAYEGGLRVPLIIKAPGVTRPGTKCGVPVISYDFFPTVLELAGGKSAASATALDGRSIVPLLRGAITPIHEALFWHYPHYWNRGKVSPYSVVRKGDYKLIRFYEEGHDELYDLARDPSETKDLLATEPERASKLSQDLEEWLKGVNAQMPVPKSR